MCSRPRSRGTPWISITGSSSGSSLSCPAERGTTCTGIVVTGDPRSANQATPSMTRSSSRRYSPGSVGACISSVSSIVVARLDVPADRGAAVVDAEHLAVGAAPVIAEVHEPIRRPRGGARVAHVDDDLADVAGFELERACRRGRSRRGTRRRRSTASACLLRRRRADGSGAGTPRHRPAPVRA